MLRPLWVRRARARRHRRDSVSSPLIHSGETLECRIVLSASTALDGGGHAGGHAEVDVPFGVFTPEEYAALESVLPDSSLSTKTPPGPAAVEDGSHEANILTFVLDFKEAAQGNTTDIFGNVISTFDVTSYGFLATDFNTVANAILAEVDEDYFTELVGTVAGPIGQDLRVDFIIGDIGTVPTGVTEYYYVQIGTGISGPHSGGTLGVAGGSVVRNSGGTGPNGVAVGDVVASVFTDAIVTLGGLSPANALTSGNLVFTTMGISGTLSHEVGHTLSLSHIDKAGSVQPTGGVSPIMGTGAIDLPNQDRITDREFSLSGVNAQAGGAAVMHIPQLVGAIGLHNTGGAGPGSIAGTKFDDLNGNGFRDAGEPGLPGWTIYIDANQNGIFDSLADGLEPDDFASGFNVSTVNPDVTLSEVDSSNNSTGVGVFSFNDLAGFSSTGTQTFAGSFTSWADGLSVRMRMDFNVVVTSVSIDAIADDASDFGRLQIFDAADTLLDTYTTADLATGVVETMTLASGTPIAYAVAYGVGADTVYLDNLVYAKPEESTITDVNGEYSFSLVPEGTHQLGEDPQAGWMSTAPNYGRLFAVADATSEIVEIDPATGLELNRFSHPGVAAGGANGLAFNGTSLFFTDRVNLFELNPNDGTILDTDSLAAVGAGPDVDALGFIDGQIVALDFTNDLAFSIDPTADLVTSSVTLDVSIDAIGGMTGAASRGSLFVSDIPANMIFEVDAATGAVINSFSTMSAATVLGLAFVNGSLFVGDNAGNLIELDPNTGALIGTTAFGGEIWNALGGDDGLNGFWSVYVAGQNVTGVNFANALPTPPTATGLVVNGGSPNRSGVGTLTIQFDEAVNVSSAAALVLFNHTTGLPVVAAGATLANNGTAAVTWNLNGFALPNGRYSVELAASEAVSVSSAANMGETVTFVFQKLAGDVSGNGTTNATDFIIVDANFDPLPGTPYRDGDANGDGRINATDFIVVDANFDPVGAGLGPALTFDFGDAPETGTSFPTTLANTGAQHVITGNTLLLGATRDAEPDGQPNATATGDGADEDGVIISGGGGALETETAVAVDVTASGTGFLNAWIDYNQDGDWDDAGEQVFTDLPVVAGVNNLMITAPAGALVGTTIGRFRLTSTAGYSYFGLVPDGEVEDYQISVNNNSDTSADLPGGEADQPLPTTYFPQEADEFELTFGAIQPEQPAFTPRQKLSMPHGFLALPDLRQDDVLGSILSSLKELRRSLIAGDQQTDPSRDSQTEIEEDAGDSSQDVWRRGNGRHRGLRW